MTRKAFLQKQEAKTNRADWNKHPVNKTKFKLNTRGVINWEIRWVGLIMSTVEPLTGRGRLRKDLNY